MEDRPGASAALIKIHIEVFSAGCAARTEVVEMVHRATGPSDEVIVSDMTDIRIATRAKSLGIRSVPSVVIDGKLPDCCSSSGVDEQVLRAAGPSDSLSSAHLAKSPLPATLACRRQSRPLSPARTADTRPLNGCRRTSARFSMTAEDAVFA